MESNITMSSLDYMERIESQNNNVPWAEQVSMEEDISPPPPNQLQGQNRQAKVNNQIYLEFTIHPSTNNMEPNPYMEPSVIPYQANGPADPNLWDGNFAPISLFGIDKFLKDNAKNIACFLQKMVVFFKQQSLVDRDIYYFPQLQKISYTTWEFISAIYKAGWDKLPTGEDSHSL